MASQYREILEERYMPIEARTLKEGVHFPCDIFIRDQAAVISLFNKNVLYDPAASLILKSKNISEVFIRIQDLPEFERYVAAPRAQKATAPEAVLFKDYSANKEQHFQIDSTLLVAGTQVCFNIYLLRKFMFTPLLQGASEASPQLIDARLLEAEGDMMIKREDVRLYLSYINSLLTPAGPVALNKPALKYRAIRENSKIVLKDLYENPRSGDNIRESIAIVNRMIDGMLEDENTIHDLISIRTYDYYTYTHSVNVAALSAGFGIAMALRRDQIETLAIGALLHDIGKSVIPHEILNKQGRLSDAEFSVMKTHVMQSEKILKPQKEIPEEAIVALLQHHEKLSGKGYPLGLSEQQIKLFGRIMAIADVYDALTTERPYKAAFTPFHAISLIVNEKGNYDPELLAVFIKLLGKANRESSEEIQN